jgi:hypothetical protein
MGKLLATTTSWADKTCVLLKGPAWRPDGELREAQHVDRDTFTTYSPSASKQLPIYVSVWFVVVGAAKVTLMRERGSDVTLSLLKSVCTTLAEHVAP